MKKDYLADPGKMAVCAATGAGMLVLAYAMLSVDKFLPALVFVGIALLYFTAAAWTGARIVWDEKGVSQYILGKKVHSLAWDEVAEVGVAGLRVFNQGAPQKTGRLYLYFSKEVMTDDMRFQMILRWPPRDKIYLLYQADRLDSLRLYWTGKIETYNEGDLEL